MQRKISLKIANAVQQEREAEEARRRRFIAPRRTSSGGPSFPRDDEENLAPSYHPYPQEESELEPDRDDRDPEESQPRTRMAASLVNDRDNRSRRGSSSPVQEPPRPGSRSRSNSNSRRPEIAQPLALAPPQEELEGDDEEDESVDVSSPDEDEDEPPARDRGSSSRAPSPSKPPTKVKDKKEKKPSKSSLYSKHGKDSKRKSINWEKEGEDPVAGSSRGKGFRDKEREGKRSGSGKVKDSPSHGSRHGLGQEYGGYNANSMSSLLQSGGSGTRGVKSSSNSRLPKYPSSEMVPARRSSAAASFSREIMPLPLEIPESVADTDAFRRYLSRSQSSMMEAPADHALGLSYAKSMTLAHQTVTVHRKTMALSHAIMTLALLSASAFQLRFVVAYSAAHAYPGLNYFLICSCIFVEVTVGIGYVVLSRFDFTEPFVEKVHSYLIFGLFFVAVCNVIIAAFALDDHVCEDMIRRTSQLGVDVVDQVPPAAPAPVQPPQPTPV